MNFKRYHVSRNLFDKSTVTHGYYISDSNGNMSTSSTYEQEANASDYILISGDSVTIYSNPVGKWRWGAFYDSNKTYILGISGYNRTVTIPENARYMRLTVVDDILDTLMVNLGSTALPYEPYSSEVWHDIPHYIMGTSTDTITTLPADIYANDTTATVGLKGQMEQSSTPSPSSPVMPQECGERTGNLFDKSTVIEGYRYDSYGELFPTPGYSASDYIPVSANESYIRNIYINTNKCVCFYKSDKTFISRQTSGTSITTPAETAYIRTSCATNDINNLMLVQGNTIPSEYIPYGYKIPIFSNSTTTNVYLGEVSTMRRIQKLVLTGGEDWSEYPNKSFTYQAYFSTGIRWAATPSICTHYSLTANQSTLMDNAYTMSQDTLYIKNDSMLSLTDFKSHLAEQYAAGTPVCVWYVLVTPKTAVVNEPIRKIDTHADKVSGITIPTIAGANTLSIGTTLQPSEVTVNYKGWHPVQSVHEYDSNYTIATMQALTIAQLQTHTISELQGGEWS